MRRAILFLPLLFIGVTDAIAIQENVTEPVVWNVSFEGNETYRTMVLKEVISTTSPAFIQKILRKYGAHLLNENEVRRDVIRLERYYQRRGFPDVDVRYEIEDRKKERRKNVIFYIRERQPLQIVSSRININADEQVIDEIESSREYQRAVERNEFREGQRYQFIRMPDVEGRFLQILENHGFAWPEVEISTDVDSLINHVEIEIQITPNTKTFFTEFLIEGELSVPERVLIRQTDIKMGTPYSRRIIQSAQRSIFNHHLFRFATITLPEQPKDSTLTALIRVRENLPRTVEASIGVGREEYVRGQIAWRHRNINGTGHRYGANIRASFIEQRVSTDYLIPYTFNARSSNVTTLFGVHRLEPTFELLQTGFNSSLIYQIARNRTASFSYEYTFNEEISRDEGTRLPDFAVSYNISSFNLSGYYSDGVSREPRGWVIQPSAEFSSTFNEADFRFQKLNLDVRRFTPITNSTTLAARINTGVIFYSQSEELPFNIRYFTGGTNSVRGWNRRELGPSIPSFDDEGNFQTYVPVGGRSTFSFNIELRQQLSSIIPNFGMALFLDGGQVWENIESIDERPIQFGAGGGMRYQSPIGPVRIDIGYKLNPTDEDLNIFDGVDYGSARSRFGIHFSIGQAF